MIECLQVMTITYLLSRKQNIIDGENSSTLQNNDNLQNNPFRQRNQIKKHSEKSKFIGWASSNFQFVPTNPRTPKTEYFRLRCERDHWIEIAKNAHKKLSLPWVKVSQYLRFWIGGKSILKKMLIKSIKFRCADTSWSVFVEILWKRDKKNERNSFRTLNARDAFWRFVSSSPSTSNKLNLEWWRQGYEVWCIVHTNLFSLFHHCWNSSNESEPLPS